MKNTTKYITMATIGLTLAFGSNTEATADVNNEVKPAKIAIKKDRVSASINGTVVPQHLPNKSKAYNLKLKRLHKVKTSSIQSIKVRPKRLNRGKRG